MTNSLRLYHTLLERLEQYLPKVRITQLRVLALAIAGVQAGGSVCLSHIARKMPVRSGKLPSLVNRLHRFLVNERVEPMAYLTPFAAALLVCMTGRTVRLVMDVTKVGLRGEKGCRVLTVSLCHRKRTLPLFSHVLEGPKGQVGWRTQKTVLSAVARLVPVGTPVLLVADAGFEAVELVRWLLAQDWDFVLRRNGKHSVRLHQPHAALGQHDPNAFIRLNALAIQPGELLDLGAVTLTKKHALEHCYLTLYWQVGEDDPWFILASFAHSKNALRAYRHRMWVEEMYGDLKEHGFDIEQTHLFHADRIGRLLMVAFIAYLLCIALGSWVVKNGLRSHVDHKSRRDKSYFRIGFDWMDISLQRSRPIQVRFCPYPN